MLRMLVGFVLAAAIAALANRLRSLTIGGAATATFIGVAALAAGWGWGALLIVYFVASTLLSRTGRAEKESRTASIVEKGGERDAVQVLANGALFAGAALAMHWMPNTRWLALGAGSLGASTADTWATEIGTMVGGTPRSILPGKRVAPGMSGGITLAGTFASLSGAAFLALAALACGWPVRAARVVVIGGIAGSLIDSILGATCQSRRWCAACATESERSVHSCGGYTTAHRGMLWIDNDTVNFVSNACGGLLAALLIR